MLKTLMNDNLYENIFIKKIVNFIGVFRVAFTAQPPVTESNDGTTRMALPVTIGNAALHTPTNCRQCRKLSSVMTTNILS